MSTTLSDHSSAVLNSISSGKKSLIAAQTPPIYLAEHSSCFLGGDVTVDDASFPTRFQFYRGPAAKCRFGCVALLDASSPQLFISATLWDGMKASGATTTNCEHITTTRSSGNFTLRRRRKYSRPFASVSNVCQSTNLRHRSQYRPMVPPTAMQHSVVLRRDSWMRFDRRSYRTPPPQRPDGRIFG